MRRALRIAASLLALLSAGCVTIGQPDFEARACVDGFTRELADILRAQGEPQRLAEGEASPAGFFVFAPSGTDYAFFVQKKPRGCLLRLYGRRRLRYELTNTITYIATRPLPDCECR
jgi:hypothetical protein